MQVTCSQRRESSARAARCGWAAMHSTLWMPCRWTRPLWSTCRTSTPWCVGLHPSARLQAAVQSMHCQLQLTAMRHCCAAHEHEARAEALTCRCQDAFGQAFNTRNCSCVRLHLQLDMKDEQFNAQLGPRRLSWHHHLLLTCKLSGGQKAV